MPIEYLEYIIMKEMGWSYQDLRNCPREMVYNIIRYLNTEGKFHKARMKHG